MSLPASTELPSFCCDLCGWVYHPSRGLPEGGIPPGTPFHALGKDWCCPGCGSLPRDFGDTGLRDDERPVTSSSPYPRPPTEVLLETAKPSPTFDAFVKARKTGTSAELPDFSWAGYAYGERPIPPASGPVFDVTRFGAKPDPAGSPIPLKSTRTDDREAIQRAIHAAEAAGGGVVFFPPGRYLVSETQGSSETIRVRGAGVVLQGSGSGPGGTELFMRHHLVPWDERLMWTTPRMIEFAPAAETIRDEDLATVTADAARGSFEIEVDDASAFAPDLVVSLQMRNPEATDEFLDGRKPWDIWTVTVEKGPLISEKHRVARVEGRKLILREPIRLALQAAHGWKVRRSTLVAGWGVENLRFTGGWECQVEHHKDAVHDGGWSFLSMTRGEEPWVRNVVAKDVNEGVLFVNCLLPTALRFAVEGEPGHSFLHVLGGCTGALVALCEDRTRGGMWHGPGANKASSGTVIWRYEGQSRGGPDFHGSWPYCTLIDRSRSCLVSNGGASRLLPNHGRDLVWWNHRHQGVPLRKHDFWESRKGTEEYSGVKVASPRLVGYHADGGSTFVEDSVALLESLGAPVTPESLWEAQLTLRLGALPAWISAENEASLGSPRG